MIATKGCSPCGQFVDHAALLDEMKTLDQITSVLSRKKPFFTQAGIKEIGVFGSYVRGEQHPDSDLDVLIDIERPARIDLLKLIDLEQELFTDLGVSVAGMRDRLIHGDDEDDSEIVWITVRVTIPAILQMIA